MYRLVFLSKKMQKDGKPFIKMYTVFSFLLTQGTI